MKVLWLDAPRSLLDDRLLTGAHRRDEMWQGVMHLVPVGSEPRQRLHSRLVTVMHDRAKAAGLRHYAGLGLFRAADDYRVPAHLCCRRDQVAEHGAEAAELVLDLRHPDDEIYEKLDFYVARGVREVIVLDDRGPVVELFREVGGRLVAVEPDETGSVSSEVLGMSLQVVDGKLRITWPEGSAEI